MAKKVFLKNEKPEVSSGFAGDGVYFTNSPEHKTLSHEMVLLPEKSAHVYLYNSEFRKIKFLIDTNPEVFDVLSVVRYHGTSKKNLEFTDPKPGKVSGKTKQQLDFGTHFSTKQYASGYVQKDGSLHKKIISGKKTLDLDIGFWSKDHPDFDAILSLIKKLGIEKRPRILFFDDPATGEKRNTLQSVVLTMHILDSLPPRKVFDALLSEGYDTVAYTPYTAVILPSLNQAKIPHEKSIIALTKEVIKDFTPENLICAYNDIKNINPNSDFVSLMDSLFFKQLPITEMGLQALINQSNTFPDFLHRIGNPVYHGYSYEDFDTRYDKPDGLRGLGWFTSNQDYAESYTNGEGALLPMTLVMNKPFVLTLDPETEMTLNEFIEFTGIRFKSPFEANEKNAIYNYYDQTRTDFLTELEKRGYDGLITIEYGNASFLPFRDNQMKSDKELWNMWLCAKAIHPQKNNIPTKAAISNALLNSPLAINHQNTLSVIIDEWAKSKRNTILQESQSIYEFLGMFTPLYHGTSEAFSDFDISKSSDGTIWFSSNESLVKNGEVGASGNNYCMERFIDEKELLLAGWDEHEKYSIDELLQMGYAGVKLPEQDQVTFRLFNTDHLYTREELIDEWKKHHLTTPLSPYHCTGFGELLKKHSSFESLYKSELLMTGKEVVDALEDMGTSGDFSPATLSDLKKQSYMLQTFSFDELRSLDASFDEFLAYESPWFPGRTAHEVKISDSMHPVMDSTGSIRDGYHRLTAYYAAGLKQVTILVGMDRSKMKEAYDWFLEKEPAINLASKKETPYYAELERMLFLENSAQMPTIESAALVSKTFDQFVSSFGQPYYHGSSVSFDKFDNAYLTQKSSGAYGSIDGFYFASDKSVAKEYGSEVQECYLTLNNPFVGDPYLHLATTLGIEIPGFGSSQKVFEKYNEKINKNTVLEHLKNNGYDGVVIPAKTRYFDFDEVIVFDASQIKTKKELHDMWVHFHPEQTHEQKTMLDYFVYHGTSKGAARRIQQEGLIPGKAIGATQHGDCRYLFFTNSLVTAESFATRKDNGYVLRVKKTLDMLPDFARVGNKKNRDYICSTNISPEDIEICVGKNQWVLLQEFDFNQPAPLQFTGASALEKKAFGDYLQFLSPIVQPFLTDSELKAKSLTSESPDVFCEKLHLLYHQSQSQESFETFLQNGDPGYAAASYSQALSGIYFSPDKDLVQQKYDKNNGALISAYIRAKKVLDLGEYDAMYFNGELCCAGQIAVENFKRSQIGETLLPEPDIELSSLSKKAVSWLQEKGYDAVEGMKGPRWTAPEVVVFDTTAVVTRSVLEKMWNEYQKDYLRTASLHFKEFDAFSKEYSLNGNHGVYYHLTDNPNWVYDSSCGSRDMSSMGSGNVLQPGSLMITADLSYWHEYYNDDSVTRPYVAVIDASQLASLNTIQRGFGHEIYLPPQEAKKVNVVTVLPIQQALEYEKHYNALIPQSKEELQALWTDAWSRSKETSRFEKINRLRELSKRCASFSDFEAVVGKHVYHGTSSAFDSFEFAPGMRSYGDFSEYTVTSSAIFFTDSKIDAWRWAKNREGVVGDKPVVMDAYIATSSTIDLSGNAIFETWVSCVSHKGKEIEVTLFEYLRDFDPVFSKWTSKEWLEIGIDSEHLKFVCDYNLNILFDDPAFVATLKQFGYDSAIVTEFGEEKSIAVFDPTLITTKKELELVWSERVKNIDDTTPPMLFGYASQATPLSEYEKELLKRYGCDTIECHTKNETVTMLSDLSRFAFLKDLLIAKNPVDHEKILSEYGTVFYRGTGGENTYSQADLLGKGTYYINQKYIAAEFGDVSTHVIPDSVVLFRKFSDEHEYVLFLKVLEDINPTFHAILKKEATHFNLSYIDLIKRTSLPTSEFLPETIRDGSQKERDTYWRALIKDNTSSALELLGYDGVVSSEGKLAGKYENLTLYGLSVSEAKERDGYYVFDNVVVFPGHTHKVLSDQCILKSFEEKKNTFVPINELLLKNKAVQDIRYVMADSSDRSAAPLLNYHKESQILVSMPPEKYLAFISANKPDWEWYYCVNPASLLELKNKLLTGTPLDPLFFDYHIDGRVLEQEGRHRAIVASILGIPEIPVIVFVKDGYTHYVSVNHELKTRVTDTIDNFVIPSEFATLDLRKTIEPIPFPQKNKEPESGRNTEAHNKEKEISLLE